MPPIEPTLLARLYRQQRRLCASTPASGAPAAMTWCRMPSSARLGRTRRRAACSPGSTPWCATPPWARSAPPAGGDDARSRVSAPEAWFAPTSEDADEAARLLAALPLELREVVVARLWGGLTFDDLARLLGCSAPTVHRRYRAGLERLRERLEGPCTPNPASPTT